MPRFPMPRSAATLTSEMLLTDTTRKSGKHDGQGQRQVNLEEPRERPVSHGDGGLAHVLVHGVEGVQRGPHEQCHRVDGQGHHHVQGVQDAGAQDGGQDDEECQRRDGVEQGAATSAPRTAVPAFLRASCASGMDSTSPSTMGTRARTRCWPALSKTMPLFDRNHSIRALPA